MGVDEKGTDSALKILIAIIVGLLVYLLFTSILGVLFFPQSMMMSHMGFSNQNPWINITALLASLLIIWSIYKHATPKKYLNHDVDIIKSALTYDEKKLLETVEEAGEITQDSIKFRLEWSRAEVSIIVSHLERMNLLQRRREGKTYVVLMTKKYRKH